MNPYLAAIYRNDHYTLGRLLSEPNSSSRQQIDESLRVILNDDDFGEDVCRTFAESLLLAGANPNGVGWNGDPLIYHVSTRGELSLVELLINFSCDVNATNKEDVSHQTALHETALNGHIAIVGLLLSAGANSNTRNMSGKTPLNLAYTRLNPDAEVISLLLIDGDVNLADYRGCSPMHNVVLDTTSGSDMNPLRKNPHVAVTELKRLISLGACIDCQSTVGETPLMIAVEHGGSGNLGVVKCLVEAGCNVNVADVDGRTALHRACDPEVDNDEVLAVILAAGADVNVRTKLCRHTPLFLAARAQKTERVRMLIQANCNLNIPGKLYQLSVSNSSSGSPMMTPLEVACRIGAFPIVKLLLVAGCKGSQDKLLFILKKQTNSSNRELAGELEKLINDLAHPRKLNEICRRTIRSVLGGNIKPKVETLHLPQSVVDFVLLKEIDICLRND